MKFQVIPAIDLMDGKVVRLVQGEREQKTTYSKHAGGVAREFAAAGCDWLHVVNLDGAFDQSDSANQAALKSIVAEQAAVQFGGGLRSLPSMRAAIVAGVDRLILGTVALQEPSTLERALAEFGAARIAVAVDLRKGVLQTHGWTAGVDLELGHYLQRLENQGVEWLIYTDADRDGTGGGLAVESARQAQDNTGINTIISGGVGELEDIRLARQAGLAGVIVGKALHDGVFTIEEALAC